MRFLLSLSFLFCSFLHFAQNLAETNALFDRFEYTLAAKGFQNNSKTQKLSQEDRKKWAYASFSVGDFIQSFALTDSLVKDPKIEMFFLYAHGYAALATGRQDIAKDYLTKHKEKAGNRDTDSLLKAINEIQAWEKWPEENLHNHPTNGARAEITSGTYNNTQILLVEKGIASNEKVVGAKDLTNAEYFFTEVYKINDRQVLQRIKFEKPLFDYPTVRSISISDTKLAIVSIEGFDKNGTYHPSNLYQTKFVNDSILGPLSPIFRQNDTLSFSSITLHKDGKWMVLTGIKKGSIEANLYQSFCNENVWSEPKLVSSLNTPGNELFPLFQGDSILTFASDGRIGYGGLDVYQTRIVSDQRFGSIKHLPFPVNGFSDDFGLNYITADSMLFCSNRFGGKGDDDLYCYAFPKKPEIVKIDTLVPEKPKTFTSLKNLTFYFDFNQSVVKQLPQELDSFITFLQSNDSLKIVIVGRTDNKGSWIYNDYLGEQRAKTVSKIIQQAGVKPDRIKIVSMGEFDPIVRCNPCLEESDAKNRVVNLDIILP